MIDEVFLLLEDNSVPLASLEAYLIKEGCRVKSERGIQKKYLDAIGPVLCSTIESILQVKKAFRPFFLKKKVRASLLLL